MPAGETHWGCTECLELGTLRHARHPEQRKGVKQEGLGTRGSHPPRARLSQGRKYLPPAPQASKISDKKAAWGEGGAGAPGMAGWAAAQTGTAPGILGLG